MSTFGVISQESSSLFCETASHRAVALAHSSRPLTANPWDLSTSIFSVLGFLAITAGFYLGSRNKLWHLTN